jgi:hypothetical protein
MENSDLLPWADHRCHCLPERFFGTKILLYPQGSTYSEISLGKHPVRHYCSSARPNTSCTSDRSLWEEEPRYHGHSVSPPRTIQNYGGHEKDKFCSKLCRLAVGDHGAAGCVESYSSKYIPSGAEAANRGANPIRALICGPGLLQA